MHFRSAGTRPVLMSEFVGRGVRSILPGLTQPLESLLQGGGPGVGQTKIIQEGRGLCHLKQ